MRFILAKVWEHWKRFGQVVGNLIGRIILTAFYFTIALPFGVGMRIFFDPLKIRSKNVGSFWLKKEMGDIVLKNARKQS
ncbi:MAG: hypothetical protein ABII09_09690 [Planctomycetota bacterium]